MKIFDNFIVALFHGITNCCSYLWPRNSETLSSCAWCGIQYDWIDRHWPKPQPESDFLSVWSAGRHVFRLTPPHTTLHSVTSQSFCHQVIAFPSNLQFKGWQVLFKIKFILHFRILRGFFFFFGASWRDKTQHICLVSASQRGKELEGGTMVGRECAWQWWWFKLMSWQLCFSSFRSCVCVHVGEATRGFGGGAGLGSSENHRVPKIIARSGNRIKKT